MIISDISLPVTMTRLTAESPPTFTVWHITGPASKRIGVKYSPGGGSSLLSEIETRDDDEGENMSTGVGVKVGVRLSGDVGREVGDSVGVGVGEDVGIVVPEGVMTVIYPDLLRLPATVIF